MLAFYHNIMTLHKNNSSGRERTPLGGNTLCNACVTNAWERVRMSGVVGSAASQWLFAQLRPFFMCVPQAAEHHLAYKHPTTGSATRRVLRVFRSMCLLSSKCTKRVMHKRTHCDRVIGFQCGSWRAEVTQIDSVTVSVWLGHGMCCYILR